MPATDRIGRYVAATGNRVLRPRDLPYQDATLTIRLLVERGALRRISHGYYLVPPDTHRGVREWHPPIEAVGLGVAVADYRQDDVALIGVSAARLRGAPPRALATAVVAIPKTHRSALETDFGRVVFVSRNVPRLDLERARTDVVDGWATSPEQTIIDIAARPDLGDISPATASEAITQLSAGCDWGLVVRLAKEQRQPAALARASWVAAAARSIEPVRISRPVPSLGMSPVEAVDPGEFGVVP